MVVADGALYVNDVFNGDVLKYSLPLGATSAPARTYDICGGFAVVVGGPGQFCALNDIVAGPTSRLYMSDNGAGFVSQLNGRIFELDPVGGTTSVFLDPSGPELDVDGFPSFGVNGIAFTLDGKTLIMANMSTDKLYKVDVQQSGGALSVVPGTLSLFASNPAIDGPDDMVFDDKGLLWVTSGQKH
jgi:sugar lactone lactonase YvrE